MVKGVFPYLIDTAIFKAQFLIRFAIKPKALTTVYRQNGKNLYLTHYRFLLLGKGKKVACNPHYF